jgi:hypothetical protein
MHAIRMGSAKGLPPRAAMRREKASRTDGARMPHGGDVARGVRASKRASGAGGGV